MALAVRVVDDARLLAPGAGIVASTVAKFATTHDAITEQRFDLLIFDEAYQTNVASSLPILTLATRSVVVGHPGQLRDFDRIIDL